MIVAAAVIILMAVGVECFMGGNRMSITNQFEKAISITNYSCIQKKFSEAEPYPSLCSGLCKKNLNMYLDLVSMIKSCYSKHLCGINFNRLTIKRIKEPLKPVDRQTECFLQGRDVVIEGAADARIISQVDDENSRDDSPVYNNDVKINLYWSNLFVNCTKTQKPRSALKHHKGMMRRILERSNLLVHLKKIICFTVENFAKYDSLHLLKLFCPQKHRKHHNTKRPQHHIIPWDNHTPSIAGWRPHSRGTTSSHTHEITPPYTHKTTHPQPHETTHPQPHETTRPRPHKMDGHPQPHRKGHPHPHRFGHPHPHRFDHPHPHRFAHPHPHRFAHPHPHGITKPHHHRINHPHKIHVYPITHRTSSPTPPSTSSPSPSPSSQTHPPTTNLPPSPPTSPSPLPTTIETQPPTTSQTQPPTTSETQPPTTSETQPPTTSETQPPTTSETQPPTTSETQPPTTSETLPPTTSETQPPTTSETQPPTTSQTQPSTTSETQPSTTSETQPPTTSETQPPTTSQTQPPSTSQTQPPTTSQTQPPTTSQTQPPTTRQVQPLTTRQTQPPTTSQTDSPSSTSHTSPPEIIHPRPHLKKHPHPGRADHHGPPPPLTHYLSRVEIAQQVSLSYKIFARPSETKSIVVKMTAGGDTDIEASVKFIDFVPPHNLPALNYSVTDLMASAKFLDVFNQKYGDLIYNLLKIISKTTCQTCPAIRQQLPVNNEQPSDDDESAPSDSDDGTDDRMASRVAKHYSKL